MRNGFSFIEAIIALMLIGFGFVGIFSLYHQNIARSDEMEQTAICTNMAQELLERITQNKRYQGYNSITNANYVSPEDLLPYGYAGYTRTSNILEVQSGDLTTPHSESGYKRVTVTVQPTGGQAITLETILTSWGPTTGGGWQ